MIYPRIYHFFMLLYDYILYVVKYLLAIIYMDFSYIVIHGNIYFIKFYGYFYNFLH